MHRVAKIAVLCCLAFVGWGYQPAAAGCQVISATHSAPNRLCGFADVPGTRGRKRQ